MKKLKFDILENQNFSHLLKVDKTTFDKVTASCGCTVSEPTEDGIKVNISKLAPVDSVIPSKLKKDNYQKNITVYLRDKKNNVVDSYRFELTVHKKLPINEHI